MFLIEKAPNALIWKKFSERYVQKSSDGTLSIAPNHYQDALKRLYELETADHNGTLFDTKIGLDSEFKLYNLSNGDADAVGSILLVPDGLHVYGLSFTDLIFRIVDRYDNKQRFDAFRTLKE